MQHHGQGETFKLYSFKNTLQKKKSHIFSFDRWNKTKKLSFTRGFVLT